MSMNICVFQGNLTRDPEFRTAQTGTSICNFSIAVNSGFGENKKTMYMDCTAFGKQAEIINENFKKGKEILVNGELVLDTWEDKDTGSKRSRHKLNLASWQGFSFTSGGGGGGEAATETVPANQEENLFGA